MKPHYRLMKLSDCTNGSVVLLLPFKKVITVHTDLK